MAKIRLVKVTPVINFIQFYGNNKYDILCYADGVLRMTFIDIFLPAISPIKHISRGSLEQLLSQILSVYEFG